MQVKYFDFITCPRNFIQNLYTIGNITRSNAMSLFQESLYFLILKFLEALVLYYVQFYYLYSTGIATIALCRIMVSFLKGLIKLTSQFD